MNHFGSAFFFVCLQAENMWWFLQRRRMNEKKKFCTTFDQVDDNLRRHEAVKFVILRVKINHSYSFVASVALKSGIHIYRAAFSCYNSSHQRTSMDVSPSFVTLNRDYTTVLACEQNMYVSKMLLEIWGWSQFWTLILSHRSFSTLYCRFFSRLVVSIGNSVTNECYIHSAEYNRLTYEITITNARMALSQYKMHKT